MNILKKDLNNYNNINNLKNENQSNILKINNNETNYLPRGYYNRGNFVELEPIFISTPTTRLGEIKTGEFCGN